MARNFFARLAPFCDQIDGVAVDSLIEQFASPLFVFSERTVLDTARRARKAFRDVYPDTIFGWSYKTNYLKAICNIFHKEGWIAEVVSDFEYQKAERAGISGKDIIYNGPCKSRDSLERALRNGSLVQMDNWDELRKVEEIVATMDHVVDIGIRIWMDTELVEPWSKFGFALDNGEATHAILKVLANPKLRLHTLHSHIGTNMLLELEGLCCCGWSALLRCASMVFEADRVIFVPCLNLGGGFPSTGRLHEMSEATKVPPIEEYAAAIAEVLNDLPSQEAAPAAAAGDGPASDRRRRLPDYVGRGRQRF